MTWRLCARTLFRFDNLSSAALFVSKVMVVVHGNRHFPLVGPKPVEIFHIVSRRAWRRCCTRTAFDLIVSEFALEHLLCVLIFGSYMHSRRGTALRVSRSCWRLLWLFSGWILSELLLWRPAITGELCRRRFRLETVLWNVWWHVFIAALRWWIYCSSHVVCSHSSHRISALLILCGILHKIWILHASRYHRWFFVIVFGFSF